MKINYKKFIIILTFFIPIIGFSVAATTASGLSPFDIKIGNFIETTLTNIFLTPLEAAITNGSGIKGAAINLFIALFIFDYMQCIATAYLQGNYNSIVATTAIKAFFFIAVKTALVGDYVFLIPKEIMESAVKIKGEPVDFSWFSIENTKSVITSANSNGLLSQIDKMVTSVSDKMLNAPDFWSGAVWAAWFVFMSISILFIYKEALKLVVGFACKTFEWAIGLPIAFLMLAGKGHPEGEEYFRLGMQYIVFVAIDFAVLMGMFVFGREIVLTTISGMNGDSSIETIITTIQVIFVVMLWVMAVLNVESLVAGIAGGAPAFKNNMGSSLVAAMGAIKNAALTPTTMIANVGSKAINSGVQGKGFFRGLGAGALESVIGAKKIGEDGKMTWDTSKSIIGAAIGGLDKDLTKGVVSKEIEKSVIDPVTGKEKKVKSKTLTTGSNSTGSKIDSYNQKNKASNDKKEKYRKFQSETNISQKDMWKMGLDTEEKQMTYMAHHDEYVELDKKLQTFGDNGYVVNAKTGHQQLVRMSDLKETLKQHQKDAKEVPGSNSQVKFSRQSDMTKKAQKDLASFSGNTAAQMKVIKNWIEDGKSDIQSFSSRSLKDATKQLASEMIKNNDQVGLDKLKKLLDEENVKMSKSCNNNELFKEIQDPNTKIAANKHYRVQMDQLNASIQSMKI